MERAGRLTYLAGWLWNLMAGLRAVVLPIVPVVILACLPGAVQPRNALLLVPALVSWLVLYPLWHNLPHSQRSWPLSLALARVGLASWRIAQTGSWRFTVAELLGVANLAVVGCLIIAGRRSS
jgi:hypothetical protein